MHCSLAAVSSLVWPRSLHLVVGSLVWLSVRTVRQASVSDTSIIQTWQSLRCSPGAYGHKMPPRMLRPWPPEPGDFQTQSKETFTPCSKESSEHVGVGGLASVPSCYPETLESAEQCASRPPSLPALKLWCGKKHRGPFHPFWLSCHELNLWL